MQARSALYQEINSYSESIIDRRFYRDYNFYLHFHANPEVVYVFEGSMDVNIDGASSEIHAGHFCIVLPWQIHSFKTRQGSRSVIVVFPSKYIRTFIQNMASFHGESQVFEADESIRELFLRHLCDDSAPDEYIFTCILFGLCHGFAKNCKIVPNSDRARTTVLVQIMNFVSEHCKDNLSLKSVSDALGYNYYYLSHLFRECTGLSFHRFCNLKRIERARTYLENTQRSITDIAFECGFASTRTFNRVFRQMMQISPSEYRSRYSVASGDGRISIYNDFTDPDSACPSFSLMSILPPQQAGGRIRLTENAGPQ
jgi:AraC-like DNA-binding protein